MHHSSHDEHDLPLKIKLSQLVSRNPVNCKTSVSVQNCFENSKYHMTHSNENEIILNSFTEVQNYCNNDNEKARHVSVNTVVAAPKKFDGPKPYQRLLESIRQQSHTLKSELCGSLNRCRVTKKSFVNFEPFNSSRRKPHKKNVQNFMELYGVNTQSNILRNEETQKSYSISPSNKPSPAIINEFPCSSSENSSTSEYWNHVNNSLKINQNDNVGIDGSVTSCSTSNTNSSILTSEDLMFISTYTKNEDNQNQNSDCLNKFPLVTDDVTNNGDSNNDLNFAKKCFKDLEPLYDVDENNNQQISSSLSSFSFDEFEFEQNEPQNIRNEKIECAKNFNSQDIVSKENILTPFISYPKNDGTVDANEFVNRI